MNSIINDFFSEKPIPEDFLLELKTKIPKSEQILCIDPMLKEFESRTSMPIQIKLSTSAILFLTYNKRLGSKKFFWAVNVLFIAAKQRLKNS